MRIARGKHRVSPRGPKVRFTSTESFANLLPAGNRDLLRVTAEKAPASLDERAQLTGRQKPHPRTLRTMAGHGLVRLERGERGRIAPRLTHHRVELELPLVGAPEGRPGV